MSRTMKLERNTIYEVTSCSVCYVDLVAPEDFLERRRKDGRSFYCLNGHSLGWKETEEDRLKQQLAQAEARAVSAEDQARAAKREAARQKKRAANGVCPCCKRSFVQLARHMKTKHPDFAAQ